jgi:diacylglycerol kinase family enzyme
MFTGGLHKSRLVDIVQAKHVRLQFQKPMAFHIDGEAHAAAQSYEVKIQPASLQMAVMDGKEKSV